MYVNCFEVLPNFHEYFLDFIIDDFASFQECEGFCLLLVRFSEEIRLLFDICSVCDGFEVDVDGLIDSGDGVIEVTFLGFKTLVVD